MNRNYNTGQSESVTYFIGQEIEKTPAYGKTTLFVVGVQDSNEILFYADNHPSKIEHIYFGANQSFPIIDFNDYNQWIQWESMIHACLEKDYWCTLDLDVNSVEGLLESGLTDKNKFIPQISVKIPYLTQLGYNATIKLDDKDFDATNPGVWCHSLHTLMDRNLYTSWDQYKQDIIIK